MMIEDPVGTLMVWISAYGLLGLFIIALLERFLPMIPSYGLFIGVGIAAVDGAWCLPAAVLATTIGSTAGCASCYYATRKVGRARSIHLIKWAARLFKMPSDRIDQRVASFQANQTVLAFTLQLVPTIRLFAPAFAALSRGNARNFLIASAAGIAAWNGIFIVVGFAVSQSNDAMNTTAVALAVLGIVLVVEAAILWIARTVKSRRCAGSAL